jgi:uncharacterized membrane protein HdeD (DUF308 family)
MAGLVSTLFQRAWWSFLIKGLVAAVFGLVALIWAGHLLTALVTVLGAFLLIIGIVAAAGALMHRSESKNWVWLMVPGAVGIVAGIICIAAPTATTVFLAFLIGVWAIVNGIIEIYNAFKLHKDVAGEWLPFLVGVVSIILGIILFLVPRTAGEALVRLIGLFALILGILWLSVAYRARKWHKPAEPQSGPA